MFTPKRGIGASFSKFYFNICVPREKYSFNSLKKKTKIKSMAESKTQSLIRDNKSNTGSKKYRFPPSEMYLSVLGNGSTSSSRALYMFTDRERYLFNCGEGTQRLANEHKMKLSKLDHIFITHKSWENLGGLLGMSLTIQDMGVQKVTIHGPPGIDSLFKYTDSFVFLPNLEIATKSHSDLSFKDDCMEVHYIPVFKSSQNSNVLQKSKDLVDKPESNKSCLDVKKSADVTIAYACKGHSKPGCLLTDKCVEFGVPVGPLLGELKNGKNVTLPSGKVVLSKDVVSEEEICPLFLVVECPSDDFLDPFVKEEKFQKYQDEKNPSQLASLVVHFTPSHILNSSKYKEWMQRFPSSTEHLILNSDCASLNSLATHRLQHQLNLLHPGMFGLLQEKEYQCSSLAANEIHPRTLERYFLRPPKKLDRSFALKIEPCEFIEEAENIEGFNSQLEILQSNIKEASVHNNELYPEILFLGTGSSIPNKVRNVSAILINSSENQCFLMDCGEGTYGQLLRLYRDGHKAKLLQLFCIFISHMHADHHLGLVKILKERQKLIENSQNEHEPVYLVGPKDLDPWLKNYYENFENVSPLYRFIECSVLKNNPFSEFPNKSQDINISTVPVIHCKDSHGVVISSKSNKWKLVYSGDTKPCEGLIEAGKNCSLLIHEATMEDELAKEAEIKRHSTTSQAIEVAENMNAKYTILTHFSQRYAKVPLFNKNFHNRVGCAFDNMKVCPKEFHILPLLLPALKSLFAEKIEELYTKGNKRRKREELMKKMLEESVSKKLCTSKR